MKKIVTLTGHKHTKKDYVAKKLAENSEVEFIKPYVDMELPKHIEPFEMEERFHIVLPTVMDDMLRDEKVLCKTEINGKRYVIFEFQMVKDYNVIIVDDYGLLQVRDNWDGEMLTIFVTSKNQKPSERVCEFLTPSEFDVRFSSDFDDFDELESMLYVG